MFADHAKQKLINIISSIYLSEIGALIACRARRLVTRMLREKRPKMMFQLFQQTIWELNIANLKKDRIQ